MKEYNQINKFDTVIFSNIISNSILMFYVKFNGLCYIKKSQLE